NAQWRTSVFGGAQVIDYNATANSILCSRFGAGSASGTLSNAATTCNMDYRVAGVGSRTYWTPVRDLTIGLEVMWTNHHSGNKGAT
ncbi:porin, partial [Klebsiella pneumoniae]|uniref:porin n=1 Tax=Klebsiella pneumoniae TaxID=573 RepID=UPI001953B595